MATTIILIDSRPDYLSCGPTVNSVLLLPLGLGTVLEYIQEQLSIADAQNTYVLPTFEPSTDYQHALLALNPEIGLIETENIGSFLASQEPSDWLLFVDVRNLPAADLESDVLSCLESDDQPVRYLVHLKLNGDGLQERVRYDDRRRISSIQRLYDGVTHVEAHGISLAFLSASIAQQYARHSDLSNLTSLRARLTECGIPSRDFTGNGTALDLTRHDDVLALNASRVYAALHGRLQSPYEEHAPGIWIGPECKIHPTSRIFAPVILHRGASIAAEAVVTGPVVLGAGAQVGRQAVIAQSLVTPEARIDARTVAVHRVITTDVDEVSDVVERARPNVWNSQIALPATAEECDDAEKDARRTARRNGRGVAIKRCVDFGLALLGLLALTPLLLIVGLLVKLTSPGPILFGHEREGRHGRIFRCWKFRTMVAHAHKQQRALYQQNSVDGPQFKLPDDPRVTWLGHWLRVTNIDELPQLYNVVRGEMSLIGPRPSPFRENQICVPWRNARLSVCPGITGLWQVCRQDRSAGDFHQWIYFDLLYVRHWSLVLDIKILLATMFTLGGRWSVPLSWMIPERIWRRESFDSQIHEHAWPILRSPQISKAGDTVGVAWSTP